MFNCYLVLFILGFCPVQSLRVDTRVSQTGPISTVAGTAMLDDAEMDGRRPLFIDAFYDHNAEKAHVILNMISFLKPSGTDIHEWARDTQWSCEWQAPSAKLQRVPGHTNLDAFASGSPILHSDLQRNSATGPNATVYSSFQAPLHWSIVVSCPAMSQRMESSSPPRLNVVGKRNGKVAYDRYSIPVSFPEIVKQDSFVLCTQYVKNQRKPKSTPLMPWAQYHLAAGFTQLLVYVEGADTSEVEEELHHFIERGQVTIVRFYFGKVSDKKTFLTQNAMENHCLYQARGRAKWMAHADVDEYFDFIGPHFDMRNHQFPELQPSDVLLVVRSQFWGTIPGEDSHRADSPFPCNINGKGEGYFPAKMRSKCIMRPEHIDGMFPHIALVEANFTSRVPDPETELRVNHLKRCQASGSGCLEKNVSLDTLNFRGRCEKIMAP